MTTVWRWVKGAWRWLRWVLGLVVVAVLAIFTGRAVKGWLSERERRKKLSRELKRRAEHREIEERCRDELDRIPDESAEDLRRRSELLFDRLRRRREDHDKGRS